MNDSPANLKPARKSLFSFWRCFWLSFLVLSLTYAWYCYYVPENDIAWADSLSGAQRRAVVSNKPVILYFTGTWCVPCRIMKRQVWADPQVMAVVNSQFVPLAVDISDTANAELMARYKVEGAPVVIVTDAQGNALDWRSGGVGKDEFLQFLSQSNQKAGQL